LLFDKWKDITYLYKFFEANKHDLQSGFYNVITVDKAVEQTIKDANKMKTFILKVAKTGRFDERNSLQDLVFTPLHKNEFSTQHLQSKAYGQAKPSWLRVYASEIDPSHYVVSGGAIKLTETMNERTHLKRELKKLKLTSDFLKEIGLSGKDDFEFVEINKEP
jgi:hypothetical protein